MKKIIGIMGPPCSGKTTQAKLLSAKLKIPYLSMGEIIREEIFAKTEIGKEISELMKKEIFIFDKLSYDLLKKHTKSMKSDLFILEGFPRSLSQLNKLQEDDSLRLIGMIELKFESLEELILRMKVRLLPSQESIKSQKREDDTVRNLKIRYCDYFKITHLIKSHLAKETLFYSVNGKNVVDEVEKEVLNYAVHIIKNS